MTLTTPLPDQDASIFTFSSSAYAVTAPAYPAYLLEPMGLTEGVHTCGIPDWELFR